MTSHSFLLDNPTDDSNLLFEAPNDYLDSNALPINSLDPSSDSLLFPSDDNTDLSSNIFTTEDPGLEFSLLDQGEALDETQTQDFAEVGNSCSAEGTGQALGRVRRQGRDICRTQAPVPYLKLPTEDSLWDLFNNKKPKKEPEVFPPRLPPGSPPNASKCPHPAYSYPVCCRGPVREKRLSILPVPIWDVIEVCKMMLPTGFCWLRYEACCLRYIPENQQGSICYVVTP